MSEPQERELCPGVFVTDFRTPESIAAFQAATVDSTQVESERKAKESAAEVDENENEQPIHAAPGASSTSHLERSVPSTFPLDIPNDVESLELELEALTKNLGQLIKSNQILEEELKENPEDQDFKDAIRENRIVIFRRSDRMKQIQQQLKLLAPHRIEAVNAQLNEAIAQQQQAAARDAAETVASPGEEGGLFL